MVRETRVISIFILLSNYLLLGVWGKRSVSTSIEQHVSWDLRCRTQHWMQIHAIRLHAIRLLQQKNSSPVALTNLNGQDLLRPSYISVFQSPRIASPYSRIHQTPCSRMRTPARANHGLSPIDTGIERAMNIENEFRTSPSQAAPDRRFYVDLSSQQEKVLLKKAKRHLKLNKQIQIELTNENFQQLIHLLAVSWSE